MIRICCEGLKWLLNATGRAGFSVKEVGNDAIKFSVVEFNAFARDRESEVKGFFAKHAEAPVLELGGELPITYCPSCGKRIWVE